HILDLPSFPTRRSSDLEVTLDIRNYKNQYAEQHCDLQNIVNKKLHTATNTSIHVQTKYRQTSPDQSVYPFHAKHLVLNKVPDSHAKTSLSFITIYQKYLI